MKRILLLLLAVAMVFGMVSNVFANGGSESSDDAIAVGIVLPTKDEPRWLQDEARFNELLTNAGYSVEILFSQGDPAKERANVEALIAKGIQVLIITPQDGAAAAATADVATAAGVKVISHDRLITGTSNVDYYVSFNSFAVGQAQGQFLIDNASGSGNNLYLYAGAATDNNAFIFFAGAWDVLQPKIADGTFVIQNSSEAVALSGKANLSREEQGQIIGQITTQWDFNVAKNLAEANLTAAPASAKGEAFILAPNDGTSRAIGDAFAADPDVTAYYSTGQDVEKASVQYVIDGRQGMSVWKDVRDLVTGSFEAAQTYLNGGTPAADTTYDNGAGDIPAKDVKVTTITQDNAHLLVDSGYYMASDFSGL